MPYNLYKRSAGKWFSDRPFQDNPRGPSGMGAYHPPRQSFSYVQIFNNLATKSRYVRAIEIKGVRDKRKYTGNIFRFIITVNLDNKFCLQDFEFRLKNEGFAYSKPVTSYSIPVSVDILSLEQLSRFLQFIHLFESLDQTIIDEIGRAYRWFVATYQDFSHLPPPPRVDATKIQPKPSADSPEGAEQVRHQATIDLNRAMITGNVETIQTLLYLGANTNAPIKHGNYCEMTPLGLAITNAIFPPDDDDSSNWLAILVWLLRYRANPTVLEVGCARVYDRALNYAIANGSRPIGMQALKIVLGYTYSMSETLPPSPEGIPPAHRAAYDAVATRYRLLHQLTSIRRVPRTVTSIEIHTPDDFPWSFLPSYFRMTNPRQSVYYTVICSKIEPCPEGSPFLMVETKRCCDLSDDEIEAMYRLCSGVVGVVAYTVEEFKEKLRPMAKAGRMDLIDIIYSRGHQIVGFNFYAILLSSSKGERMGVVYAGLAFSGISSQDRIKNFMTFLSFRMAFLLTKFGLPSFVIFKASHDSFEQLNHFEVENNGVRVGPYPKFRNEIDDELMRFLIGLVYGQDIADQFAPPCLPKPEGKERNSNPVDPDRRLRSGNCRFFFELNDHGRKVLPVAVKADRKQLVHFSRTLANSFDGFRMEDHLDTIMRIVRSKWDLFSPLHDAGSAPEEMAITGPHTADLTTH